MATFGNKFRISGHASVDSVGPDPLKDGAFNAAAGVNEQINNQAKDRKKTKLKSEYIPGQDSLEGPQKDKKGNNGLKVAILVIAMALAIFALLAFQFLNTSSDGTVPAPEDPARQREIEALRAREEAEQKLALTEHKYNEAINQMDELIAQRVAEELAKRQEPASGGVSTELAEQLRSISESQERMRQEMARISAQKEEEMLQPKEGSSAPTISFNMLPQIKQAQEEENKRLLEAQNKEPDIDVRMGLQMGHLIPAKLDNAIYSSTLLEGYWVTATTTEPFEITKGYILPKGVRFLGKASADMDSRRIVVNIERLQYGSSTVKVKGMILDRLGSPGLVSKYVDPLDRAILPIMLTSFASATAEALQDMTGYYNRIDGSYYERPDFNAGNAALQGTADTLESAANLIAASAARKKPVIIVRSGIDVKVQISDKLTMDKLIESGIVRPVR